MARPMNPARRAIKKGAAIATAPDVFAMKARAKPIMT
jgi:hypothetical protein